MSALKEWTQYSLVLFSVLLFIPPLFLTSQNCSNLMIHHVLQCDVFTETEKQQFVSIFLLTAWVMELITDTAYIES